MTVDQRLNEATTALEHAIEGSPPPLRRRQPSAGPALVIGSLVVAGGGLVMLQGEGEGPAETAIIQTETGEQPPTEDSSTAGTDPAPAGHSDEPQSDEEVVEAMEVGEDPMFHALAVDPPDGWTLERAVVLDPADYPSDAAGAVDLLIQPQDWLPIGPHTSITVSVQQALYRNPAEAEDLSVRSRDATLLADGSALTLTWVEESGVHVVMHSFGYDRADLLAAAEGLWIDNDELTATAGAIPDGSTATPGSELPEPAVSLLYRHEDGSEATVRATQFDRGPTDAERSALVDLDGGELTVIDRPEGIGISFLAHGADPVINWWGQDGLVLTLQSKTGVVPDSVLAELAGSIAPVDANAWRAAGGE